MFTYKLGKAKPSMEDSGLEMRPGEVDGKEWKESISAGAHLHVYTDALLGVISSIIGYLKTKGLDKSTINAKVIELLNLMVTNGDIDDKLKGYILKNDHVEDGNWEIYSMFDKVNSTSERWSSWWKIISATRNGVSWAPYSSDSFKNKMNDREKQLLETLEQARKAYWDAQSKYDRYVYDHAIMTINEIFVKYSDVFQRMAKEWFDTITTQYLKYEVEQVEKRRKEKAGEDDETSERAELAEEG